MNVTIPESADEDYKMQTALRGQDVADAMKNGEEVVIINAIISGDCLLDSETLSGKVTIENTRFTGKVDWSHCTFYQVLRLIGCTFENSFIVESAEFQKDVFFGLEGFRRTIFKSDVKFNGAHLKKRVFFPRSWFEGKADFTTASFGGQANFTDTKFMLKESAEAVTFNHARIEGPAYFRGAEFEGEVNFSGVQISAIAGFQTTKFKAETKRATFNSAHIEGPAYFRGAEFEGEANFSLVQFGREVNFAEAKFESSSKSISFNNAQIYGNAIFSSAKFDGPIDLRGCTYNQLQPDGVWKTLLRKQQPFDREPYTHLERLLRKEGNDRKADEVYLEWMKQRPVSKFFRPVDLLWRYFTGYGVSIGRVWILLLFFFVLGIGVFGSCEGALEPSQDFVDRMEESSLGAISSFERWETALFVTLDVFVPVIEFPTSGKWEPSSAFWLFWGILTIVGSILIPLGLAGLAGLIKKPAAGPEP